jgi:hypothetical protein
MFETDIADRFPRCDRLVNDLRPNEGFAGTTPEWVKVDVPRAQLSAATIKLANPSPIHENSTALTVRDKANDTWGLTRAPRYDNNVFNTADLRATRVKKRKSRHSEGINHIARHGRRLPLFRA